MDGTIATNTAKETRSTWLCGGIRGTVATRQNNTDWFPINSTSDAAGETTQVNASIVAPHTGTLKNLRVYMVSRGHASITFTIDVNESTSGLTVTANADTTLFSDTAHTFAVSAGDRITMELAMSNDAGNTICGWGVELVE